MLSRFYLLWTLKIIVSSSLAKAKDIRLGFGAHILAGGYPSPLDKHEVRMDVEEIIIHPGYSR